MAPAATGESPGNWYNNSALAAPEPLRETAQSPAAAPDPATGTRKNFTIEVRHVSGPGTEFLSRTQYEAIKEVLTWLTTN